MRHDCNGRQVGQIDRPAVVVPAPGCAKTFTLKNRKTVFISGMNFQVRADFHIWEGSHLFSMMASQSEHYINVAVQRLMT